MAVDLVMQGDIPLTTTITLTDAANGSAAVPVGSGAGVSSVTAALYSYASGATLTPIFTGRGCAVVGDGSTGQVTISWQSGDFSGTGLFYLYVQLHYSAGNLVTTPLPIVIDVRSPTAL